MNSREKTLALLVGFLVVALGMIYIGDMFMDEYSKLDMDIKAAKEKQIEQDTDIKVGERSTEYLTGLEERALPWDRDDANKLYQSWLLDVIKRVDLQDPNVAAVPARAHRDGVYFVHNFNITCKGNIKQLTEFLYEFYALDFLHQFENITLRPVRNQKQMSLTFMIEVLSLPHSPNRAQLNSAPSKDVDLEEVETYVKAIVGRNPFSPPNKAPSLRLPSRQQVAINERLELSAEGSDEDKNDKLTYSADLEELPGAQLDESSGKLSWRPDKLGKVVLTMYATDDGFPAQTVSREVEISVVEPNEPEPSAPGFDSAKLAFVTGITTSRGKPQLWLSVRSEGKILKLHEGDSFEVGQVKAVISRIGRRQIEFQTDDGRRKIVALGKNIAESVDAPTGE